MKKQPGLFHHRTKSVLPFWSFLLFCVLIPLQILNAQSQSDNQDEIIISFEDRLAFYLDQQSRTFLQDMALREELLLRMIENITEELKARGKNAVANDELGYEQIFGEADRLIGEYDTELTLLLAILEEIDHLGKIADQSRDLGTWEALAELREKMLNVLANREIFKKGKYTERRVRELFSEYHSEIDSMMAVYDRLLNLKRTAGLQRDYQILSRIESQIDSIDAVFSAQSKAVVDSAMTSDYSAEVDALTRVLDELTLLQKKAVTYDVELSLDAEETRRDIIKSLDRRIIDLTGYTNLLSDPEMTVSDFLHEWKAKQYTDYNIHFTQYQIMKRSLLDRGTPEQQTRMLQRDLVDAFLNYVQKNYKLAEQQFNLVLEDYGDNIESLEAIIFYRGESLFARHVYSDAIRDYERIVQEFPDAGYLEDSLFRLMVIFDKLGEHELFYTYYDHLSALGARISPATKNKCDYLAGFVYYHDGRFSEARKALSGIPHDSEYFLMARYLQGVLYSNEENFFTARRIFSELADQTAYPWTSPQTIFVGNNAALKLGYIEYELGEYDKALAHFRQVSPGFDDYDQALLGSAWANLKSGNFDGTIDDVNRMFQDYLASRYTYEALVLSAHCKRLVKKQDAALEDLRYVAKARRVLELSDQYNEEKKLIYDQLAALQQLENEVFERKDRDLFAVTSQIRNQLQDVLSQFQNSEASSISVIEAYEGEQALIAQQVAELGKISDEAFSAGDIRLASVAEKQRERLVRALAAYQADLSKPNVLNFTDYPLATREGSLRYRNALILDLEEAAALEGRNIESNFDEIEKLKELLSKASLDTEAKTDLALLEADVARLREDSERFQVWIAENRVEELKTDFNLWADFSGFGMSDIAFAGMREKELEIQEMSSNRSSIAGLLEERKGMLEGRLRDFENEIKRIEEDLRLEQIEIEKQQRREYFETLYFDTNERETREREKRSSSTGDSGMN